MREREIKNAKISSTMLGWEDHGIFTFSIGMDYGGSGQGFGQFTLDEPIKKNGEFMGRVGTAAGMDAIMKVLKVVGVEKWEALKGQVVRVDGDFSQIYRIGNVLEDKWFDIEEHFKSWGIK